MGNWHRNKMGIKSVGGGSILDLAPDFYFNGYEGNPLSGTTFLDNSGNGNDFVKLAGTTMTWDSEVNAIEQLNFRNTSYGGPLQNYYGHTYVMENDPIITSQFQLLSIENIGNIQVRLNFYQAPNINFIGVAGFFKAVIQIDATGNIRGYQNDGSLVTGPSTAPNSIGDMYLGSSGSNASWSGHLRQLYIWNKHDFTDNELLEIFNLMP